jgi:predicted RNA-binding Zn ribbon-like protein
MELPELVALVNEWGSTPREVEQRPSSPGHADLVAVADRLHPVFAAADTASRARLVSAMLASTGVRPDVTEGDGVVTAAWLVPAARDALLASAALALREHLVAHPDRLGVCGDRQCADVYVDASPAGHRRFCSLTCQNRSRVAAFRERKRGAG